MDTYYYAKSRNGSHLLQTLKTRSELIQAELGSNHYTYSYDNIGNRKTAQELAEESTYEANQLNQYREITQGAEPFTPIFDADGNQTLIKTSTGIWTVSYNADNCPTSFTQAQGAQRSIIECGYDYMGRRYMKKVTSNGTVTLQQRYIYRGYLQIACVDLTRSGHPALWYITWDPTEPVATRPLAIQKNATWYSYSHDLTKNVTELYKTDGLIATSYDYSPYGVATAEGTDQPLQWSSEYHDPELALTYYNYRHYNPTDGRWLNRDPIGENGGVNLYTFVQNRPILETDYLGDMVNAATNITMPNTVKEKNFQALINNIKKQVKEQKLCCLPELTMAIHGNPTFAIMGDGRDSPDNNRSKDPAKANYLNENNIGALFSSLSSQVTFCSPCLIYFLSCNIGLGRLPQIISDSTQCSVRAPMGYCFPNISKPANRKVAPSIPGYPTYPNSKPSFGEFSPSHQSK